MAAEIESEGELAMTFSTDCLYCRRARCAVDAAVVYGDEVEAERLREELRKITEEF